MATYTGFKCDKCGSVIGAEERTRRTVRFEGPLIEGEYHEDLCPECVVQPPEGVELRPLRRRRKSEKPEAPLGVPGPEQTAEPLSGVPGVTATV